MFNKIIGFLTHLVPNDKNITKTLNIFSFESFRRRMALYKHIQCEVIFQFE